MRALLALVLAVAPALAQPGFYPFAVDQDRLSGAPDFSFLNHPLTPADRVFVRDGHFFRVGADARPNTADDQRVRLFGVNLAFSANFPEPADARRIAMRLRRLGVNLVRLHHMDTSPDADPERAGSTLTLGPYPTLNPVAIARLRGLLDAFSAQGIYVNLNLHVGYRFRPEADRVPAPVPEQSKPLHIFYPRMVELQCQYTRNLIRALRLDQDPVLAMVELDNETSLVYAYQNGSLEHAATGAYADELERQWKQYLAARHIEQARRPEDYVRFLVDRDRAYLGRMLGAVRETAGALVPVAGTQVGFGGPLNYWSHQDLDYQDNHFYLDHYNFPHRAWDAADWRIRDASAVGSGLEPYLSMALAREAGRPYTVSEFNQPWPNRQAAESDPTLAAFAAFQDWDAVMHFAYSHGRAWDKRVPGGFDLNSDWTKMPGFGQAAWLFRTAAVRAGAAPLVVPIAEEQAVQWAGEKRGGNLARLLLPLVPGLALLHPVAVQRGSGVAAPATELTPPYRSDTGELLYDPGAKIFRVAAPAAAGVFGFLPRDREITGGAVQVQLGPSARGFVSILVTSLDGRPIPESTHLLISDPGSTLATVAGSDPPRREELVPYQGDPGWWTIQSGAPGHPSGPRDGGAPPSYMERVEAFVTIAGAARTVQVYPLDGAGSRLEALGPPALRRTKEGITIHLQQEGQTFAPWYEVVLRR